MPKYPTIKSTPNFMNPDKVLIEAGVSQNMIVADFGAGSGFFVFAASNLVGNQGLVYAIDVQKTVLSFIRSKMRMLGVTNIKCVWADLEIPKATRIVSGSCDMILLIHLLHQTKKHKIIFEEVKRVLKPKGKILILDWKKTATPLGPPVSVRISEEQVKKEVESFGFKFENKIAVDNYHYGMLFNKT